MTRKLVYIETQRHHREGHEDGEDIYGLHNLEDDFAKERIKGRETPSQESSPVLSSVLQSRKGKTVNSFTMKLLLLSLMVLILVSTLVSGQEPPIQKCKKRESVPDCLPARKFCSDVKKGVEEEDDVCIPNAAKECFCMTGSVWAEVGGQCIPDKLCKWMHG